MTPFEIGYALDVFTEQPHVSDVKLALIRLDVPIDQMPQAQREYVIELLEELYEVQQFFAEKQFTQSQLHACLRDECGGPFRYFSEEQTRYAVRTAQAYHGRYTAMSDEPVSLLSQALPSYESLRNGQVS